MIEKNKSTKLADKLFPEVEEINLDILNIPPDKRRLNTETYDFTVSSLIDYLKNGHIIIPEFQRGYVWNRAQASRLIESLIINCPIPVIFLSQNPDETLAVIDGNQRLNSIKLYLADDFELRGLTAYPELEGFKFSELDPRFQRHIQNRTVRCIVILKDTHPQIKFDVFERLNTGSVKLNSHELRHGIHSGPFMELLEKLGNDKTFRELTLNKADKRMKSDELVLRFLSLAENWRNYTKPLVAFLNGYSEANRNANAGKLIECENDFRNTLNTVNSALHKYAFKTYDESLKNAKFNAALYDAQMISFYELNPSQEKIEALANKNFISKNQKFIESEDFNKFISSGTTDKNSVVGRINEYKEFLKNLL
ncbi:Protein of unknown function DUF262 [Lunatimonas lonarensis]|uniref:GmrSD restriction endonucleases N-terminal domain-containing protein n=1 Tax=Lunatimonas lonarensis TaxID=1232681 RepID=R7ZYU2_9BACT|nr:DUF262 domain-containing protein [Lunatimonas lonarensis]EON79224.1 Protein of unknown function DUF262 [Lunatimonas lonarensis]